MHVRVRKGLPCSFKNCDYATGYGYGSTRASRAMHSYFPVWLCGSSYERGLRVVRKRKFAGLRVEGELASGRKRVPNFLFGRTRSIRLAGGVYNKGVRFVYPGAIKKKAAS